MKRRLSQEGENRARESAPESTESRGHVTQGSKKKSVVPLTTKLGFKRYNQVIGTGAAK